MRRTLTLVTAVLFAVPAGGSAATPDAAPAEDQVTATANMSAVARIPFRGGTDLEFATIRGRRYVVSGSQNNYNPTVSPGLRLTDVTDPTHPVKGGFLPCNTSQNDIQVRGHYAFLAVDFNQKSDSLDRADCFSQVSPDLSPAGGVVVVDLADPWRPRAVGFVAVPGAAHNTTAHPTQPYLYVSESEGLSPGAPAPVHIVDWSNPRAPTLLPDFGLGLVDSAHDITFNADGSRAYVAAGFGGFVVILDTTKPTEPAVLGRINDLAINFTHQADPTPDGNYLLITDELAGAEGNLFCPGGGIHVWDISDETRPVKVGAYFIPETYAFAGWGPRPAPVPGVPNIFRCTAHVMRIAPDSKTLVMGWYSEGIQVLDISGIGPGVSVGFGGQEPRMGIRRLGYWKVAFGDAWSAKMDDRGYVYTGDTQRGMDIVRYSAETPASVEPGVWLTPAQALERSVRDKAAQPDRTYFCFEVATRLGR